MRTVRAARRAMMVRPGGKSADRGREHQHQRSDGDDDGSPSRWGDGNHESLQEERCGLKAMRTKRSAPNEGTETPRPHRAHHAPASGTMRGMTSRHPAQAASQSVGCAPAGSPARKAAPPRRHQRTWATPSLATSPWSLPCRAPSEQLVIERTGTLFDDCRTCQARVAANLDVERRAESPAWWDQLSGLCRLEPGDQVGEPGCIGGQVSGGHRDLLSRRGRLLGGGRELLSGR